MVRIRVLIKSLNCKDHRKTMTRTFDSGSVWLGLGFDSVNRQTQYQCMLSPGVLFYFTVTLFPGRHLGTKPWDEQPSLVYTSSTTTVRDQDRAIRVQWREHRRWNCGWIHEAGQREHEVRHIFTFIKRWWSLVAGRENLQGCPCYISKLSRAYWWRNDMGMHEFEFGSDGLR